MRRSEGGFALVATLWFLALLALVSVLIEGWITSAIDRASGLKARAAAAVAVVEATDRVGFMLAAGGTGPRGLELAPAPAHAAVVGSARHDDGPYVALDGRPYRFGKLTLRLQDEGGLLDLAGADRASLVRLVAALGVPTIQADRMVAALSDDTRQPANRTGDDAAASGTGGAAPRRVLVTPWELHRIPGWAAAEGLWQPAAPIADLVTTGPASRLNANTAPAAVLAAVADIDPSSAERLVERRTLRPLGDIGDLQGALPLRDAARLQVAPSGIVRLTLTADGDPLARIVSLRATPGGTAPFRIDYAVDLPPSLRDDERQPAALPDLPPAPAAPRQ